MALAAQAPRSLLQELHEDEEASAAVEFLVLLPVYLLMIVALVLFGNLALARASLVSAAQIRAWDPEQRFSDQQLERALFGPNQHFGAFSTQGGGQAMHRPATSSAGAVQAADLQPNNGAPGNAVPLAVRALNNLGSQNQSDFPFWRSEARCNFDYDGITMNPFGVGANMIRQTTYSAVLLPREHRRPFFQPGQQHPIVALSGNAYFDPNDPADQPLSPEYRQRRFQGDGIWDADARIDGSMQSEHRYFQGQTKVNLGIMR